MENSYFYPCPVCRLLNEIGFKRGLLQTTSHHALMWEGVQ